MATISEKGAEFSAKEVVIVMGAGAALIVLFYYLAKKEVKDAAESVGNTAKKVAQTVAPAVEKVNPFDQNNVVATVANAIYQSASPKAAKQGTTLATWLTDFTWVNNYDPNDDNAG